MQTVNIGTQVNDPSIGCGYKLPCGLCMHTNSICPYHAKASWDITFSSQMGQRVDTNPNGPPGINTILNKAEENSNG